MKRLLSVPAFLFAAVPCSALVVRNYDPAVHDRFTGYPDAPVMNPGFLYDASRFTGVGWNSSSDFQFTLVTPRHFLCANHTIAKPAVGITIHFVGKDGTVFDRIVTEVTTIANDSGGDSDLVVGTLNATLPASVVPLPWLNLGGSNNNESSYQNKPLIVLGKKARGGQGTLSGFQTVTEGTDVLDTRMSYFTYSTTSGGANDACFEGGDSGSPTFGTATNGEPALIGTHSTTGTFSNDATTLVNFDTFLPHYISKVNTLLATSGYRVRPANASATTVTLASAHSPAALTQAGAGSATFTVTDSGSASTGNVELTLSFPAGTAPDFVAMSGWVVEATGTGTWSLRKATLAAGANGVATATWATLPGVASIPVTTTLRSDATALVSGQTTLTLGSAYAAWAQGLSAAGETADPDGDGVPNLLEYAFGGDPATAANTVSNNSQPLLPQIAIADGTVTVSYPERSDATARSLSYVLETSTTLDNWSATLPAGNATTTQPLNSAVPGLVLRQVTWPADAGPWFIRVRVTLNEPQ